MSRAMRSLGEIAAEAGARCLCRPCARPFPLRDRGARCGDRIHQALARRLSATWRIPRPPELASGARTSGAGELEEGLSLYHTAFAADDYHGPALVKLIDGPSFLWRAEFAGHPRGPEQWKALHAFAQRSFPRPGTAFADWHMALIDAVLSDTSSAEAREREIEDMIGAGRYSAGPSVPTVARALAAFQRQDFASAITLIEAMFPERDRLSGSRAQIDLVEFTLLEAYLAIGRFEEARQLIVRRRGPRCIPVAGLEVLELS